MSDFCARQGVSVTAYEYTPSTQQRSITQKQRKILILSDFCARQGVSAMAYAIRRARNNAVLRKKQHLFLISSDFCAEQGASTTTYEYTSSAKQRSYAQKAPKLRDVIEFEVVN